MAKNEPNYIKVTQLASSDSATTVGAIFPDSQYLDTTTSGFSSSDINGRVASSGLIKQELDKKVNLTGATFTGTITTASQDSAIILPNNAMIKTTISDSLRTIYGYDANNDNIVVGSSNTKLLLRGNTPNPKYNGNNLALYSDINPGTVTSVRVQATSPVQSSSSSAATTTLNTTISLADGYGDTKNPYTAKAAHYVLAGPTSGNASKPSFRALDASDIPNLNASKIIGGGTISYNNSDTALYLKGNSASSYIGFRDSSNTAIGYFGVNASKKPVFYDTSDHQLAYSSDIQTVNNSTITLQSSSVTDTFTLNRSSDKTVEFKTINNQPIIGSGNLTIGGEGILGGMSLTFIRKCSSLYDVNTTHFEYGNYLLVPAGFPTWLRKKGGTTSAADNIYASEWIQASYSLLTDSKAFIVYLNDTEYHIGSVGQCYVFQVNLPSS